MGDLSLNWGGDLSASPSGDFATASGEVLSRQRVIRRLLTNPRLVLADGTVRDPDYLYDPTYGDGLGRSVGSDTGVSNQDDVTAFVRNSLRGEDTVDQTQSVTVTTSSITGTGSIRIQISYVVLATGKRTALPDLIAA